MFTNETWIVCAFAAGGNANIQFLRPRVELASVRSMRPYFTAKMNSLLPANTFLLSLRFVPLLLITNALFVNEIIFVET